MASNSGGQLKAFIKRTTEAGGPEPDSGDPLGYWVRVAEFWHDQWAAAENNWSNEVSELGDKLDASESRLGKVAELIGEIETDQHPDDEGLSIMDWKSYALLDEAYEIALGERVVEEHKPCTCHPDDNPPRPCPRKYALHECRAAADEGRGHDEATLKAAWEAINAKIKRGPLQGNGCDDMATRNGLVIASNIIMSMREEIAEAGQCRCTMAQKMVGDGCAICNPERASDLETAAERQWPICSRCNQPADPKYLVCDDCESESTRDASEWGRRHAD